MQEEIIIDGVNVTGCEFAVKPKNDNRIKCHCAKGLLQIAKMQEQPESIKSGLCENNPDCYYKQLKRLEQENKDLKKQIESDKGLITVGGKQQYQYLQRIDELEQENKELKEEIQFHNKENSNLLAERNALQIGYDEIREIRERYRSALEEIREIVKADCKGCTAECDCDEDCTRYKIKNKINEVLSNDGN